MIRPVTIALALAAITITCTPVGGERYSRKQAQQSLKKLESPGLVIGEFPITKVIDGDTVKVSGLDANLRLVGIDAEETFKSEKDRRAVESNWEQYMKDARKGGKRPVKFASPMGEMAKEWGQQWFAGVDKVRVERDHAAEIRDRYDRYLAYVFAPKNGQWLNYNVELVRAGMSPYFPKYGFSRRFHNEFVAAQDEAKNARRGIWAPGVKAYPDYPEREAWWMARGAFMESFRNTGNGKSNYIDLTHWSSMTQLEEHANKEVHIISTVSDIYISQSNAPSRVMLSTGGKHNFPVIFFDKDVLGSSGVLDWKGEFIVVTGVPTFYTFKGSNKKQLQIVVERANQIKLSQIPGLTPAGTVPPPSQPPPPTPPAR